MFPVFSPRAQSTWHTSPSISRHASWSSGPGHSLGTRSDIIYIICNIYNMYNCTTCIISIISVIQVSLSLFNNKNHVDLSDYWKSGTWDIIEVPAYLNVNNNTGEDTRLLYPAICQYSAGAGCGRCTDGLWAPAHNPPSSRAVSMFAVLLPALLCVATLAVLGHGNMSADNILWQQQHLLVIRSLQQYSLN